MFLFQIVGLDEDSAEFKAFSIFDHLYPCTKIMWIPDPKAVYPDLLATSGDYLRLWKVVGIMIKYSRTSFGRKFFMI